MHRPSRNRTPDRPDGTVRPRIRIGQISIDALRLTEAIDAIEALVTGGRGGMVFTPNVDHVVVAEQDARLRAAYQAADLSLVDGTPVLWAARLLGRSLPEKVSGSDLIEPLVARAAERGWRIYLLGAREGVAARAKEVLEQQYPGLQVVGTSSPDVDLAKDPTDQEDVLAAVRAARPQLLFLALGAPKQEIWAHRIRDLVGPAVILGIGASLDFIAGTAKRAPRWVSDAGFEWLYRLAHEPGRLWRRYLIRGPRFLSVVLRETRLARR
jgi:N-acetylglucosaminyldiphosphoundecaprenol N-acetyl-beta-D-mannosaminyltransferase